MPHDDDRPIFVLGCPRSGTTLLQLMLHSHHRIAIPPETRFLIPTYTHRLSFGDLEQRANRRRLARFIVRRRTRFEELGLPRKAIVRQIADGPPTVGSALGIVLRAYARLFDCPRWGDKRPAYHGYIDVLMRLFPDAHLVHVVRDPRDCVASLKRMPWFRASSHFAVAEWAAAIRHTDAAKRRWPDALTRVRYETLVADPERELRALCAALGEAYDPAMAEPRRVADIAVPLRQAWHSNTRAEVSAASVGGWTKGLDRWEVALCETALAGPMRRFGYEPSGAGRPPAEHLLRYASAEAARGARRARRRTEDRVRRLREPNPVAARLTAALV
jgi:Sulfotransferase family